LLYRNRNSATLSGMYLRLILWKVPDNAPLEDAPEALKRLGVNRADDILPGSMVNHGAGIFERRSAGQRPAAPSSRIA